MSPTRSAGDPLRLGGEGEGAPVLLRAHTAGAGEVQAQRGGVDEAHLGGDAVDRQVGALQQLLRGAHPVGGDPGVGGRAGLVALRRYRGGTSAIGKAFYKGGFEKTMNKREAALILECS